MNNGPLLFLGILASVAGSFWALLLAPHLQLGSQQPVVLESTGELYPAGRPGLARQGAEVYRSLGCAECHSQQVRQKGVSFELWLADAGTNKAELASAVSSLLGASSDSARLVEQAPVKLLAGLSLEAAQKKAGRLTNGGARAQAVLATLGPDIQRGWGRRLTVTQDYLHDYPVQLGKLRVGPDLANYGARNPGAAVILAHLYAPQKTVPKSIMPPYRFLFDKRKLNEGEQATLAVEPGYELTPKPEAEALVSYLMSLRAEASLPEAPVPAPPVRPPSLPGALAPGPPK